jgi:hypothetical protein
VADSGRPRRSGRYGEGPGQRQETRRSGGVPADDEERKEAIQLGSEADHGMADEEKEGKSEGGDDLMYYEEEEGKYNDPASEATPFSRDYPFRSYDESSDVANQRHFGVELSETEAIGLTEEETSRWEQALLEGEEYSSFAGVSSFALRPQEELSTYCTEIAQQAREGGSSTGRGFAQFANSKGEKRQRELGGPRQYGFGKGKEK